MSAQARRQALPDTQAGRGRVASTPQASSHQGRPIWPLADAGASYAKKKRLTHALLVRKNKHRRQLGLATQTRYKHVRTDDNGYSSWPLFTTRGMTRRQPRQCLHPMTNPFLRTFRLTRHPSSLPSLPSPTFPQTHNSRQAAK